MPGILFHRFISENFASHIEGGKEYISIIPYDSINYYELSDNVITPEIKDNAIKGYFIYPSRLFVNVTKTANTNENLTTDVVTIFSAIESSADGYPSEGDIKGLFADFNRTTNRRDCTTTDKTMTWQTCSKVSQDWNLVIFMAAI